MIDIAYYVLLGLQIVGGATVAFRILAPLTASKKDDKILQFLELVLEKVALNKDNSKIEVKIK